MVAMHQTGRKIVRADNSPAQWAFSRALGDRRYTLEAIRLFLERDDIPYAHATRKAEMAQMNFKRTLSASDNVNKHGWKLCHIDDIGLRSRTNPDQLPIERLIDHFSLFLKPSNHFLVPHAWSGLGELPEVIEEIRKVERPQPPIVSSTGES
jgi:hypothetical protein